MCKRKPGPRCHYEYKMKWDNIKAQFSSAKRHLRNLKRRGAPESAIKRQEEIVADLANKNYHRMREYYASPYARYKLVNDELPAAYEEVNKREMAMIRAEDRLADLKATGANAKEIAAAERKLASAQRGYDEANAHYLRRAQELTDGAARWHEANANLTIQEHRDGALEAKNYHAALYSEEDLKTVKAWDGIALTSRPGDERHAKIKWEKGTPRAKKALGTTRTYQRAAEGRQHDAVIRTLQIETPTFERYTGHVAVELVHRKDVGGYVVQAHTELGTLTSPKTEDQSTADTPQGRLEQRRVGRSALPNYEHRPRRQRPAIDCDVEEVNDKISLSVDGGRVYKTKEEAARAAQKWISSDEPARRIANIARIRAVRIQMVKDGYTTREAQDAKLAEQKREYEAAGKPRYGLPLSRPEQAERQRLAAEARREGRSR